MPHSLTFKLSAAFIGVSLGAIVLVALVSWYAATNEFSRFVGQQAQDDFVFFVSDYYDANTSLEGIDKAIGVRMAQPVDTQFGQARFMPFGLANPSGFVVAPVEGLRVGEQVPPGLMTSGTKIVDGGQVIAVVLPRTPPFPRNRAQEQFIERTLSTLLWSAAGASIVALVVGLWLARTITRPVQELTTAAKSMAQGNLTQTVRVQSDDEVGDLARAFNQMSTDLARSDRVRRQMTADIAHELRNPLTVIGGYLEAMRVGDLEPTPKRLDAVHEEVEHLEHIVEDLRTLTLTDAGVLVLHRQPIPVDELLRRVANRFEHQAAQKGVALSVLADARLPWLDADDARLTQVLDNLVGNALVHTGRGGRIDLSANTRDGAVEIRVADSGSGITPEDLPRVFDRFYRGDAARTASGGSSGLGLAIAKALVEAHGGTLTVESIPDKGATFIVVLPT